jgi:membrane peptidoglycan carboxypeptidase
MRALTLYNSDGCVAHKVAVLLWPASSAPATGYGTVCPMYHWSLLSWPKALLIALIIPIISLTVLVVSQPIEDDVVVGGALIDAHITHLAPLDIPTTPTSSRLLSASGQVIATFTYQNRQPVGLSEISPLVPMALVAAEDHTFYSNDGVDARGIIRAAINDLLNRPIQGGSSITQQYVKNLIELATKEPAAETLSRKLHEVVYARQLTTELTKDQIMDGYLNTVYFGDGAYGIQAAAESYFSIPAANLDLAQAALLVSLVRDPDGYNPLTNPAAALRARNQVLASMSDTGAVPNSQAVAAGATSLGLAPSSPKATGCSNSTTPYFCWYVWNQLLSSPQLGPTVAARTEALYAGGLTIHSTLSLTDQSHAQGAVISKVGYSSPIGTAMVTITPATGSIDAMAQNRIYGINTKKNQTEINYATSVSPVGSTFKIFTLAAALLEHISPSIILPGGAAYHSTIFKNPPGGYYTNAEPYDPTNIDMATATADSVNTAFVQLEEKVGIAPIARVAHAMGLTSLPLTGPDAPKPTEGSLTLGARSFSPVEMSSAYATLAAGGLYCAPRAISAITFPDHQTTLVPPTCRQVIPASVADEVTSLLTGVIQYGTGTAAAIPGHELAGKTGTTQNYGAAWFDGYTPQLVTATWMGNPLGPSHPLLDVDGVAPVYGGTLPAAEFATAMAADLAKLPDVPLVTSGAARILSAPVIPTLYGLPGSLAVARLAQLGLRVRGSVPSYVTRSIPAPGSPIVAGSRVLLLGSS